MFVKQDPMRRVVYALLPIFLWSIYLYGWRVVALTAFVLLIGTLVEFIFEKSRQKKVSEAVLVTSLLLALSLPPGVPFWVAGVGIVFAVLFGKEVYGGFGRNVYNPAITGRTFTYISFPLMMQTTWMLPGNWGLGGMNHQVQGSGWLEAVFMIALVAGLFVYITQKERKSQALITSIGLVVGVTIAFYVITAYAGLRGAAAPWNEIDVVTTATPLEIFKGLAGAGTSYHAAPGYEYLTDNSAWNLFWGLRVGSIGEGSIFLILLAAIYLLWTKTANWRPLLWTVVSGLILTVAFYYSGALGQRFPLLTVKAALGDQCNDIVRFLMSGSLLFVAVFMATDPVSAPKKPMAQHVYGFLIGSITIVIRVFAGFPEGVSFAILTANTFASLLDEVLPGKKKAPAKKSAAVAAGGAA